MFSFYKRDTIYIDIVTHSKGHIIDFIILRKQDNFSLHDLTIEDQISDHYMVSCRIAAEKPKVPEKKQVSYRKYQDIDIDALKQDIRESDVINADTDTCLDSLINKLDTSMTNILDKHAPIIKRQIRLKQREPWITLSVIQALRRLRVSERAYRKKTKLL